MTIFHDPAIHESCHVPALAYTKTLARYEDERQLFELVMVRKPGQLQPCFYLITLYVRGMYAGAYETASYQEAARQFGRVLAQNPPYETQLEGSTA